jgi:hypothetical protein
MCILEPISVNSLSPNFLPGASPTVPSALPHIQVAARVAAPVNLWLFTRVITPAVLLVPLTRVDCLRPHLNFSTTFTCVILSIQ